MARLIGEVACAFWQAAGGRDRFGRPVDLERAVALVLPLGVCRLPALSTAKVAAILERIGTIPWTEGQDRPLRGCLIADLGIGLVFLDGDDPPDERRYSLAHEVAHFLLHYLQPRRRVMDALGAEMIEVLDRKRIPTMPERLSAALRDIALEPFRHAMSRTPGGTIAHSRTETMEAEADELAVELLAPASELRQMRRLRPAAMAAEFGIPEWTLAGLPIHTVGSSTSGIVSIFKK